MRILIDTLEQWIYSFLPHSEMLDTYLWIPLILGLKVLVAIAIILVVVALLTLWERKVLGAIQLRKGPNVAGPFGILQPFADGGKLFLKETIIPKGAHKGIFLLAPILALTFALANWVVIPIGENLVFADINIGILYILAVSSLSVYSIILAGWASNSQYAFYGAIRSASQMIAYEVSLGLIIIAVVLYTGTLNISAIVMAQANEGWFIVKLFPMAVLFYIVTLAETNRHPFDLPESEADLVSGYNVEYSGFTFGMFFLGEYANMILMCALTSILFLGGWLPPFAWSGFDYVPSFFWLLLKIMILLTIMIQIRTTLPRYRYDQLMRLGWKVFLPLALLGVIMIAGYLVYGGNIQG